MATPRYYMACIDLTGRAVLVVGAGRVALEKIEGLLAAGAEITVVAAYLTIVGMFVIFPLMICALIAATLAAMPFGVFGENLPMPTPSSLMP